MKNEILKARFYPFGVLLSSLIAYLEWGGGQSAFLFEMEVQLFSDLFHQPEHFAHPLILLPLFGQMVLVYLITKPQAKRIGPLVAIISIGILLVFVLLGALLSWNPLMLISVLPFILISLLWMLKYPSLKAQSSQSE
ncbi:hypothetical protein [Croceimicrobium hydrocarbonivorans]|uniref:Uncharacterized protein n=1 Tax=Croceimicrobium hydrocarbonivorans TaxID=2761580 RepID=A0A7H0VFU1_9FLAO|nr:hypothetical protein [Croceimicrobium hydrocarbonivorans]QNR24589.1 hypothetical protein H4K34_01740 [Croceimicrobium hydrocarbonivorans]